MINSNTYYESKKSGTNGGYFQGKKSQNWAIGQKVNVGFLKGLEVIKFEAVKDGLPDIYTLRSEKGAIYEFIPHNGLKRIN